jgi:rod shape-determining protein MreC
VARVTAVQHDPGLPFSQVAATPLAELNRSREVLLVWPGKTTVLDTGEKSPAETPDAAQAPAPDGVQTGSQAAPAAASGAAAATASEPATAEDTE